MNNLNERVKGLKLVTGPTSVKVELVGNELSSTINADVDQVRSLTVALLGSVKH